LTVTQQEVAPVWQTYLDLQNDVKGWLAGYPTSDTSRDVQLQLVTDMACQWVQNYLGRPIAPTQFFRLFNGWTSFNGAYISLPYYPVIGNITVNEWWGTSGEHTLSEQTPEAQGSQDCYQLDRIRGVVIRTFMGLVQRPWFPGSRNIEITWTAGYDPAPADVKVATLELIRAWWTSTQQASRSFRGPNQDDFGGGHELWPTVPPHVTQLLQTYLQVGIS
jgi:hypothetical protein